jgi:hypothetical protein
MKREEGGFHAVIACPLLLFSTPSFASHPPLVGIALSSK